MIVQGLHSLLCTSLDIFAPWPRNGAQRDVPWSTRYIGGWFRVSGKLLKLATHKLAAWLLRKSFYIATGNDVIGYFWSATNSANATCATANFIIRKYFCRLSGKLLWASNFKLYHSVAHESLYISTANDVTIYFRSAANGTKRVNFGSFCGRDFSIKTQPISKKFTGL